MKTNTQLSLFLTDGYPNSALNGMGDELKVLKRFGILGRLRGSIPRWGAAKAIFEITNLFINNG